MKVLVAYATTTGHTRKIARFVADRAFDLGHRVELLPLADATDIDLSRFDKVILAASVHAGHYQAALSDFVEAQKDGLSKVEDIFITVSLTASGHDAEDWRALEHIGEDLSEATGWHPDFIENVAGAYLPEEYDIIRRFVMRRIIALKDPEADLSANKEYTDWDDLGAKVDAWLAD